MLGKTCLITFSVYLTFATLSSAYTSCKVDGDCPNLQVCKETLGSCHSQGCFVYKRCTAVENVSTCPEPDGTSVSCFPLYCYGGICSKGRYKKLGEDCTDGTQCDAPAGHYCDLNNHKCQIRTGPSCLTDNSVCKSGQDCCKKGKCCKSGTCPENGGSCA